VYRFRTTNRMVTVSGSGAPSFDGDLVRLRLLITEQMG